MQTDDVWVLPIPQQQLDFFVRIMFWFINYLPIVKNTRALRHSISSAVHHIPVNLRYLEPRNDEMEIITLRVSLHIISFLCKTFPRYPRKARPSHPECIHRQLVGQNVKHTGCSLPFQSPNQHQKINSINAWPRVAPKKISVLPTDGNVFSRGGWWIRPSVLPKKIAFSSGEGGRSESAAICGAAFFLEQPSLTHSFCSTGSIFQN